MGKSGLQKNCALSRAWLDPATRDHFNWSWSTDTGKSPEAECDGQVKSKMCFLHRLLSSGCLGLLVSPWFYLLVILAVEMDSVGLETAQEGNIG